MACEVVSLPPYLGNRAAALPWLAAVTSQSEAEMEILLHSTLNAEAYKVRLLIENISEHWDTPAVRSVKTLAKVGEP